MAKKSRQTFLKRQREARRAEKAAEKRRKREERRRKAAEGEPVDDGIDSIEFDEYGRPIIPETADPDTLPVEAESDPSDQEEEPVAEREEHG